MTTFTRRNLSSAAAGATAAAALSIDVSLCAATPPAGYVEKDGTGYRLVPIVWNPSI